ncbi:serine/threonine-protein kinase [Actinoallomurus sp. NPDC050550]|uniref:serine/threonine-protein kinase n=1 Tax=Actinoallomurus sp. NPDC050550 TaxID=3154937 RepID=UPI0034003D83
MVEPRPLQLGDPLRLGGYELEGRLGEGGQGVVYLGRDALGRQVAVKLLRAQLVADEAMRARFARELAVIERVAGFCTAQVLDADVVGDQPYIVSEYVPGPSLLQLVMEEGPREGTELDRLAIGAATALAAIHRTGIVHRDFKPANVLVGPDGPRVIDFGIARALESGADSTTASGVVGTPAYMAPEQIAGERVTPAADVFSWAATMVFAATGGPPFGADSIPSVMNRILNAAPDLSGVPVALLPLLERCLAKDPAVRPQAQELLLQLIGERPGEPGKEPAQSPVPPPRPTPPPHQAPPTVVSPAPRRRIALITAAALCGTLVLTAAAVGAWRYAPGIGSADSLALPPDGATLLQAASADVQALGSYDYRRFDIDVQSAHSKMTDRMRKQYDSSLPNLRASAQRLKAVVAGTVVAAGLESAGADHATALIFLNELSTKAQQQEPATSLSDLRVSLLRQQGQWRIDQVDALSAAPAPIKGAPWPGSRVSAVFHAAQSCISTMYSTDYQRLDGMIAAVRHCSTGEFHDQWTGGEAQLRSTIEKSQAVSRVTRIDVGLVAPAGPSQATVLVAVGTQARSQGTQKPYSRFTRLRATMTRVAGRWLLAKVEMINAP